jgi:hypothetical protein
MSLVGFLDGRLCFLQFGNEGHRFGVGRFCCIVGHHEVAHTLPDLFMFRV